MIDARHGAVSPRSPASRTGGGRGGASGSRAPPEPTPPGGAIGRGERDTARAIVALAHSLGAMVIAEGVARAEDMSALWALGFDGLTGSAVTAGAAATGTVAPPESAPLSDDQATVPA